MSRGCSGEYLSRVRGDCDLQLSVVERSPYTTTLNLTYLIPDQEATRRFPDMGVRVYHDARLVEAQEWAHSPRTRGSAGAAQYGGL